MNEMSDQQQSVSTAVQQMQQSQLVQQQQQQQQEVEQNEMIQQPQQVQVMIEQPQNRMNMHMLSDASTDGTAQHLHSMDPTSTNDTFGPMPNPMVWPSQQQQDHAQMGKQTDGWNPEHVQFIQQANSQFMHYNDQIFLPRRMFLRSIPGSTQVTSQEKALSFPTRNVALPTATNQSLAMDQLNVITNWPNIEHNEMQQKCVSCVTEKPVQQNAEKVQYSPFQQYNASFPRAFAWATQQFPPLLDYTSNHPNLIRSARSKPDNQQQVQAAGYAQNYPQQHYDQAVARTVGETVGVRSPDVTAAIPAGGVDGQHDDRQQQNNGAVHDRSVVMSVVARSSQTSTAPRLPFPEVPVAAVLKPDESLETSVVQIQETLTTAEAAESVVSDEDGATDKALRKALIKPQIYTHVVEGIVVQESCRTISEVSVSDGPDSVYDAVRDGENVTSDEEPTRKKIKSDAKGPGNIQTRNKYKRVNAQKRLGVSENRSRTGRVDQIGCEIIRCSVSNASPLDIWLNEVQNQQANFGLPSELASKRIMSWTVKDVRKVIVSVADCDEIAAKFEHHEIDGHALTLLELVHLVRYMGIKLGPALKLLSSLDEFYAKIRELQSQPRSRVYNYKPYRPTRF